MIGNLKARFFLIYNVKHTTLTISLEFISKKINMSSNLTLSSTSITNCSDLSGSNLTIDSSVCKSNEFEIKQTQSRIVGSNGDVTFALNVDSQASLVVREGSSGSISLSTGASGVSVGDIGTTKIVPTHPLNVHGANDGVAVRVEDGSVWANGGILASSDRRIKENIAPSDTAEDLNILNSFEVTKYDYKSGTESGIEGFIAQQIREVMPSAVKLVKGQVPCFVDCIDVTTTPHSSAVSGSVSAVEFSMSGVNVGDILLGELSVQSIEGNVVNMAARGVIQAISDSTVNETGLKVVTLKIKLNTMLKSSDSVESLTFDKKIVSDFHTLCKDRIAAVHVGATQRLSQRVNELSTELTELKKLMREKLGWA